MNRLLPRITVVTPSYNQAAFLEATIRSVLDQDYPNLQYGVVDGASTDGSADIIERYRDRLDFAIIEPDRGQVDALNKGLAKADGEIVCFLNSDDTFLPGALRAVGEHFRDHPAESWAMGHCVFIDGHGRRVADDEWGGDRMTATAIDGLAHALLRHKPFVMPQPSIFWKRSLYAEHGPFDESLEYTFDYEMWCRYLAAGHRPAIIDRELSTYRLHEQSKTCALRYKQLRDHIETERRYASHLTLTQRVRLARDIGYRTRQLAVMTARGRPWKQLVRRPWWVLSEQFREALVKGPTHAATGAQEQKDQAAEATTWDRVYAQPDARLAADRLARERGRQRWTRLRDHLRQTYGTRRLRCVELGAGEGDLSVLLVQQGHDVTLVDFSDAALEAAKRRFAALGLKANFVKADLFAFAQEHGGEFDVAVSLGVAEHFSGAKRQRIIAAHALVLNDGGTAFISVPNKRCLPYRLWKLYLEARGMWRYGYEAPFTPGELRKVARQSGLNRCATYQSGFAASVDGCLLELATGRRRGWGDGPRLLNKLGGWEVNLIGRPNKRAA